MAQEGIVGWNLPGKIAPRARGDELANIILPPLSAKLWRAATISDGRGKATPVTNT